MIILVCRYFFNPAFAVKKWRFENCQKQIFVQLKFKRFKKKTRLRDLTKKIITLTNIVRYMGNLITHHKIRHGGE